MLFPHAGLPVNLGLYFWFGVMAYVNLGLFLLMVFGVAVVAFGMYVFDRIFG